VHARARSENRKEGRSLGRFVKPRQYMHNVLPKLNLRYRHHEYRLSSSFHAATDYTALI
jgi:hypothetical protein